MEINQLSIWMLLSILITSVLFLISYIATLIHQAKRKKWIWFVITLLINITTIIYWITWIFNGEKWNRRKR